MPTPDDQLNEQPAPPIMPPDVARALELIAEASPELAEMIEALPVASDQ